MKSSTLAAFAAWLCTGCGSIPDGTPADAAPPPLPLEGGAIDLPHCGYTITTRTYASAPQPGEAELGALPEPFHLHLGLTGAPTTSMVVTWRTRDDATLATTVQYGKAGVGEHEQEGITWVYAAGFGGNGQLVRIHETHLCGLEPDTLYRYRVGGRGADGAEAWSPEYSFRTAPDLTLDPSAEVVVLVLGDTRGGYDVFGQMLQLGQALASPDLILFTGDAVTFGQLQEEWDAYFDAGEPVLRTVPMLMAHGNHDTNSVGFFSQLAMPGDEQVFSIDYGPLHLVVLNDTPEDAADIEGSTADFLAADLAANADKAWKVAMHHRPLWSAAQNHGSDARLQAAWGTLYDQHRVDLVVNGHDHNYERTHPMRGAVPQASPADGTVYLVAGAAGAGLYDAGMQPWTAYSEKAQNLAVLTLRAGRLDLRAYRADGSTMDQLTIAKPRAP